MLDPKRGNRVLWLWGSVLWRGLDPGLPPANLGTQNQLFLIFTPQISHL